MFSEMTLFRGHLPEIRWEIVRSVDLSDYFCIIRVPQGFFSMHSEMDFKQQKIVISCKFISPDSGEKSYFVKQLDNTLIYLELITQWNL